MKTSRRPRLWVGLVVVGSIITIAGSLLPWFKVSGGGVIVGATKVTGSPPGWKTSHGLIALVAIGGALLFGLVGTFGRLRRVAGLLVLAGAFVGATFAFQDFRYPKREYIDYVAEKTPSRQTPAEIRSSLEDLFNISRDIGARRGIGSEAALGGSAVAALGGIGLLTGRRRRVEVVDGPGQVVHDAGVVDAEDPLAGG